MELIIKGTPHEIAALVIEAQGRRSEKTFAEIVFERKDAYKAVIAAQAKRDTDQEAR